MLGVRRAGGCILTDIVTSHIVLSWPALASNSLEVSIGKGIAGKGYGPLCILLQLWQPLVLSLWVW